MLRPAAYAAPEWAQVRDEVEAAGSAAVEARNGSLTALMSPFALAWPCLARPLQCLVGDYFTPRPKE